MKVKLIPAQPGFFSLCDDLMGDTLSVSEPIIAWMIEYDWIEDSTYYVVKPVVPSGVTPRWFVRPDGCVEDREFEVGYDSIQKAVISMKEGKV